jgi:hypothetical protein
MPIGSPCVRVEVSWVIGEEEEEVQKSLVNGH